MIRDRERSGGELDENDMSNKFSLRNLFRFSVPKLFSLWYSAIDKSCAMRKREIQSFSLKLNDLKEYEAVRQERNKQREKADGLASGTEPVSAQTQPISKFGPKSKQEIRERIGLNME